MHCILFSLFFHCHFINKVFELNVLVGLLYFLPAFSMFIQFTKFKATCVYQQFDLGRCSNFFTYVLKHVLYSCSTCKLTILCLCQNCYTVNIYVFPITNNVMLSKQLPLLLFRLFCFFGIILLPNSGNCPPQFVYLTGSPAQCFK